MKLIKLKVADGAFDSLRPGKIVVFPNGEEWIVVEPSNISTHGYISSGEKEVRIKPFNELSKKGNVSLSIPIDEKYFNKERLKIK